MEIEVAFQILRRCSPVSSKLCLNVGGCYLHYKRTLSDKATTKLDACWGKHFWNVNMCIFEGIRFNLWKISSAPVNRKIYLYGNSTQWSSDTHLCCRANSGTSSLFSSSNIESVGPGVCEHSPDNKTSVWIGFAERALFERVPVRDSSGRGVRMRSVPH